MKTLQIRAPQSDEFAQFYAGYVAAIGNEDVPALLEGQIPTLRQVCADLSEEQALYRYAPGKWSVKEVIGHLADSERVFAYRALRISRGDRTPLPGFDEKSYVAAGDFDRRGIDELLDDLEVLRTSTLRLFKHVEAERWEWRGVANGKEVSLRALAYIIAGHTQHHTRILASRYGLKFA